MIDRRLFFRCCPYVSIFAGTVFALAMQVDAQSRRLTPTATPTPSPSLDRAVAWQNNAFHDGNNSSSTIKPPLTVKWQRDLASEGHSFISYPLIAQGLVIVTTMDSSPPANGSDYPKSLIAFDEVTGQEVWSVPIHGIYGFANAAYDAGKVFVINGNGLMQAFDAASGTQVWSAQMQNQFQFTSPPTAANGIVFVGGSGNAGTLYAVSESNGAVLWTAFVKNGDHSSPTVTSTSVFVSYDCPQSYAFAPATGQAQWHYSGACEGGGGRTAVYHNGKLYVRDVEAAPTNGLILDAAKGTTAGSFDSIPPPAFSGNIAVYLQEGGTLRGFDLSTGKVLWSFAGDGQLVSAPLIVNQTIYVGSSSGLLYGLDLQGHQIWSTQFGVPVPAGDEQNGTMLAGFGAGDSLLVVPTGSILTAYSGAINPTPTPTPSATPVFSPGPDTSVTFQNNVAHDGNNSASALNPPLTLKWQHDFTSAGVDSITYPVIAQGLVVVATVGFPTASPKSLVAFNETNGVQMWSVDIAGSFGSIGISYDAGKIFVVNYDGLLQAFDAASGQLGWSVKFPIQYAFTSPPTAINGTVFVGGAGQGATLYAVDQRTGGILWASDMPSGGDHSSPAVSGGNVFVSYVCPQSYGFDSLSGQLLWHYSGPCDGGGGRTPVVHAGKVYVRDVSNSATNGLILGAGTGANLGGFDSDPPPAFAGNLGLYLQSGILRGVDLTTGTAQWSFAGDGQLTSAPLVVNQRVYIGSNSGLLYAVDLQGNQVWSTQVGASILAPEEARPVPPSGFGAGDGLLVVPAGPILAVYAGTTATPTPTPTATPVQTVAAPIISPNGGTFKKQVTITMSDATAGATIYYTTDGSDPTTSSTVYNTGGRNKKKPKGFKLSGQGAHTVKAKAIESGYDNSAITTANFIID